MGEGGVEEFTTLSLGISKQQKIHHSSRKMPELHGKPGGNEGENGTTRQTRKEQHELQRIREAMRSGSSNSSGWHRGQA